MRLTRTFAHSFTLPNFYRQGQSRLLPRRSQVDEERDKPRIMRLVSFVKCLCTQFLRQQEMM